MKQLCFICPATWDVIKSKAKLWEYCAEASALTIQDSNLNSTLIFTSSHSLRLIGMNKVTRNEQDQWKWCLGSFAPTFPYPSKESMLTAILLHKISQGVSLVVTMLQCSMTPQTFLRWWAVSIMKLGSDICKPPSSEAATMKDKPSHGQPSHHCTTPLKYRHWPRESELCYPAPKGWGTTTAGDPAEVPSSAALL